MPRRPHPPVSHGSPDPGPFEPLLGSRSVDEDDRRISGLEPEPSAKAVRKGEIVSVNRLHADLLDHGHRRGSADPAVPRR